MLQAMQDQRPRITKVLECQVSGPLCVKMLSELRAT